MSSPLEGIEVLSLAWMLPGPYCSMLLADLGAEVVIVERPGTGDPGRQIPWFFPAVNRNKKSITLNLQSEQGRDICRKLAGRADVVIEGFRPGVAKRLGIDYESLIKANPRIIYASISGYGQDGPYRDKPAHDINYQGMVGILAGKMFGGDGAPVLPSLAIADLSSSMFAAIGILAALHERGESGKGRHIDVSMADGLVSWMTISLTQYLNLGKEPPDFLEPAYGIFQTKDGKYLSLGIAFEDVFWRNLCRAIGRDDLGQIPRDERVERREELTGILRGIILGRTHDEWMETLASTDVPVAPVYEPIDVPNDPHLKARGMFTEAEGSGGEKVKLVAPALKISGVRGEIRMPPPELGEHTEEVLLSLGYGEAEIESMRGNVI